MLKPSIFFTSLYLSSWVHADLPLLLENTIATQGKYTIDLGTIYSNTKVNNPKFSNYNLIQISPSSFISIPNTISSEPIQNEYLVTTIGLKYGIFQNLDIGLRTNFLYNSNKYLNPNSQEKSTSEIRFSDLSINMNYQFLQDGKYPAILGFIETSLLEKNEYQNTNFSNWSLGITAYKSYDPIVLSLTTGYRYNLPRKVTNEDKYLPGNLLFINPQVSFVANEKISLIAGLNFKSTNSDKFNNRVIERKNSSLDYSFGVGIALSRVSNFNFLGTIKEDFNNSSEIHLNYSHNF